VRLQASAKAGATSTKAITRALRSFWREDRVIESSYGRPPATI